MSTKKLQILGELGTKIYTQNEEPEDAKDGSIWIDMDDTGSSLTTAVGGAGNKYQLIETITPLSKGLIIRVKTPDDVPYNFSSVIIKINLNKKTMTEYSNVSYYASQKVENEIVTIAVNDRSGDAYAIHEVYLDKGMWRANYTNMTAANVSAPLYSADKNAIGKMEDLYPSIQRISIDTVPAGVTIEIYGVWKNS